MTHLTQRAVWCDRRIIVNPYHMAVCLSEAAFHRLLRGMAVPRDHWPTWIKSPQAHATVHYLEGLSSGKLVAVVCMRGWEGRNPIEVAGLLVHEAVHIWQAVRDNIGERDPSPEFEAYSVQAIAQDLMQGFVDAGGASGR